MAEIKIPIFRGMYEAESGVEVSSMDTRIINGFRDQFEAIHKRPALNEVTTLLDVGASTYGTKDIYFTAFSSNIYASDNNRLHIVAASSSSWYIYQCDMREVSGSDPQLIIHNEFEKVEAFAGSNLLVNPPKYTEGSDETDQASIFILISDLIYKYVSSTLTAVEIIDPALTGLPMIDIAFVNKRLLIIKDASDQVFYSATGDPTDFTIVSGGGFFTAESQADNLSRLFSNGSDVYLFGRNSIDMYYDTGDATTPFARYDGAEIKMGLVSPNLVIQDGSAFYFHANDGMIHALLGRETKMISGPINKYLSKITNIGSGSAQHLKVSGEDFFLFTYPDCVSIDTPFVTSGSADGVTFVYHSQLNAWYIWTDTDPITSMNIRSAGFADSFGRSYIADFTLQKLQELRLDTGYSGAKEKLIVTSGNISLDTHKRKASARITGRLKGTVGPTLRFREGPSSDVTWPAFSTRTISLTDTNGELFRLNRMGQYRIRQYQVIHSDNTPFSMSDITEEVVVLDS